MIGSFLKKVFGTQNERVLKSIEPLVLKINEKESTYKVMSNEQLQAAYKKLQIDYESGKSLDDLLIDSFAITREVANRTLSMRHFNVQLIGGIVLHQGKIAEMKTGEGKTLVSTLPIVLNALTKKNIHLITVNDYLAKRDALWMGPIYKFLGLNVGVIQQENKSYLVEFEDEKTFKTKLVPCERKDAYLADVTYGVNSEFGFDYLRDNMAYSKDEWVQRGFYYAIIDEVDSILIDEARTPLIISGPSGTPTKVYYEVDKAVSQLTKDDYEVDEKLKTAVLTDKGVEKIQKLLHLDNLYDSKNIEIIHIVNQSLKAHTLFLRDRDYIVKDAKVIIIDEFTGRMMPDRRYSDGLHQCIEAKEKVKIQEESQTLATITFQNYYRMYEKLCGMTGTADTESREFKEIYNLDVVVIPTNKPMIRIDRQDLIFKTHKEKINAIINEIKARYEKGQPVLVGTTSVEKSEELHKILIKMRIPHMVLNAKHHEKEAEIIAQAGKKKAVTIATNMAGRGVDIKIDEEVAKLGGLFILGTERHESRRVDNQLRGRAGRQGDPGESRFFLSLEDDLLRIFGSERIQVIMDKLGIAEGEAIENKFVTRAVENAQKKVEEYNFDIRKHLLDYDNVANTQRSVIYRQRKEILESESVKDTILDFIDDVISSIVDSYLENIIDLKALKLKFKQIFNLEIDIDENEKDREKIFDQLKNLVLAVYKEKEDILQDQMRDLERNILLQVLDSAWREHLKNMDALRESIGLRGYGQRDPLVEYKKASFEMFEDMINNLKEECLSTLFHLKIVFDN
ncbi:MAG: preprotein translocase subunit SecA [Desulfurella sp.]|uniref:preprotein translocase subunit SecA n=2 Tax=Desulfurellaceae TaxID=117942 RepID=UPI0003E0B701|nr:preprotein translocase subunit SecA [Desulfurella multipotens]AHF96577.1 preprotein translocase subunit SecA [Desulfurella acetivorans A63]PMP69019.1 MAG: preprotein translocase subunit SecA [Desulfurella multipotens]